MRVTQVAIRSTTASDNAGRPSLTPELLAACGARYSRSNEGLEAILAKVDPDDPDKSVDSIFRMVDYGHQSIADMAPVSMFIDGITIWLAYYVWTLCPTAGGQESSTRYIEMSVKGLPEPGRLGIPEDLHQKWSTQMKWCFDAYDQAVKHWEAVAAANPSVAHIPASLMSDPSDRAQRQVARMKRNYGFDRARYFLPVAALTNVMLIMSARGWVQLCQHLLSHFLPEAVQLGERIQEEMKLCAPRLLRHAVKKESIANGLRREFDMLVTQARGASEDSRSAEEAAERPDTATLEVTLPPGIKATDVAGDLAFHDNRYAWIGEGLKRTGVRFGWKAVALAEIRDLNRHRTGTKYCPLNPCGFYFASDQLPVGAAPEGGALLDELAVSAWDLTMQAKQQLSAGKSWYIYWTTLGTQYAFEHITTADKFIYEAELRTGTGAHFRYAKHLRDVLCLWYEKFPLTRELILEGSAEPE